MMFSIFKSKKQKNEIFAPIKGICRDITESSDEVFSSKVMGDGVIIEPTSSLVVAPCEGKLKMIFPTKHALGIIMENGTEILIHIGIDTVGLNGEGFTSLVQENEKITKGQPLIEIDQEFIKEKGYSLTTFVVLTELANRNFKKMNIGKTVSVDNVILVSD